jgi:AbrB family looped-hinge helix DNA binding protein
MTHSLKQAAGWSGTGQTSPVCFRSPTTKSLLALVDKAQPWPSRSLSPVPSMTNVIAYARVDARGRITIPVSVRRRLKLRPGDQVALVTSGNRMIFRVHRRVRSRAL